MRILAVDPGSVRVGLALSDETGTLASPFGVLRAGTDLVEQLAGTASDAGAEMVIVGLPRRLDGSKGPEEAEARQLAERLRAKGVKVELWDERFTSRMAERVIAGTRSRRNSVERRRSAGRIDEVAAAILLQSYLDRPR